MGAALVKLWRAIVAGVTAGTLRQSILDGVDIVTWGLEHPGAVGTMADMARMARMARAGALGGSGAPDDELASQQETGPERGGH